MDECGDWPAPDKFSFWDVYVAWTSYRGLKGFGKDEDVYVVFMTFVRCFGFAVRIWYILGFWLGGRAVGIVGFACT